MHKVEKWLWLSGFIVVCDRLSKWCVSEALALGEGIPIIPGLNIALLHNAGAAFGILASAGGWQRWFLLFVSATVCTFLFVWLRRLKSQETACAIGIALMIGGALGNMIDRAWMGFVVDFIDIYYLGYHWPTFNIAGSAITVGAATTIMSTWRNGSTTS